MTTPRVAPFTGAWIEIMYPDAARNNAMSLPSRERGLKSYRRMALARNSWSLPSRERGLKYDYNRHISTVGASRSLHGSVD